MSTVDYRDARVDDAALIAALFARSFTETFGRLYAEEDLASFLEGVTADAYAKELSNPEFRMRIAFADGQAVGFAKLGPPSLPVDTPADTRELWQIYILRPWQGAGIGPSLYQWAETTARALGARHLQLTVYIDNHRARAFYERRGFVEVGQYAFMVGNHADDDRIMRLAL